MHDVIKRLGKPRSWWICILSALTAIGVGGPLVGLAIAGVEHAAIIGSWVVLICWLVGIVALVIYYNGMFRDRYRNLQGKSWAQLPW